MPLNRNLVHLEIITYYTLLYLAPQHTILLPPLLLLLLPLLLLQLLQLLLMLSVCLASSATHNTMTKAVLSDWRIFCGKRTLKPIF